VKVVRIEFSGALCVFENLSLRISTELISFDKSRFRYCFGLATIV